MRKRLFNGPLPVLVTSLVTLTGSTALAQQAAPPSPPASGLGKQVAPTQVVYPDPSQVIDDAIGEMEGQQLTPQQAARIKRLMLQKERQKASPYPTVAKPITRTLPVSLDPGISPPVLRLNSGQLTSIVFSDVSGSPWYIESVSLNRRLFRDSRGGDQGTAPEAPPTNVLSIEPVTPAAYGNVTVLLRGLSTPVIFVLATDQPEVDMRVDAKIPGRNPDADGAIAITNMPAIDQALTYFLDAVPPREARRLRVEGLEGTEAWAYQDNLYVRAKADAQYPAYISAARSTSGVSVYRYAGLYSSVTFTTGGQAVTVFIE